MLLQSRHQIGVASADLHCYCSISNWSCCSLCTSWRKLFLGMHAEAITSIKRGSCALYFWRAVTLTGQKHVPFISHYLLEPSAPKRHSFALSRLQGLVAAGYVRLVPSPWPLTSVMNSSPLSPSKQLMRHWLRIDIIRGTLHTPPTMLHACVFDD